MANKDLIKLQNNMLTSQAKNFANRFNSEIESGKIQDEGSILYKIFAEIRELFSRIGKPTMKLRKIFSGSPPSSEDINATFSEVYEDTRVLFDEQKLLSNGIKLNFNYGVTERLRLRNKVRKVGEMINDYIVMAKNTIGKRIIIQDTFVTKDLTDLSLVSSPATVSTEEGIVTLGIVGRTNRTKDASVIGEPVLNKPEAMISNFLIPYQKNALGSDKASEIINSRPDYDSSRASENWDLEFNTDPHANLKAIFDEEPNTWVEWQLINIPDEYKNKDHPQTKGFGMTYKDGTPIYGGEKGKDNLRVVFITKLKEPTTINKIVLNPYFPPGSKLKYKINEVSTSLNNSSDYSIVFLDNGDYSQTLGGDPADNAADIERKDRTKYSDVGTWVFPSRKAQFIKIDLTCEEAYDSKIAHVFWEREYDVVKDTNFSLLFIPVYKKSTVTHIRERYEGPQFDKERFKDYFETFEFEIAGVVGGVAGGLIGAALLGASVGLLIPAAIGLLVGLFSDYSVTHNIQNLKYHDKYGLDIIDGWRWCIGIRDLNAYADIYANNSTFLSTTFSCPKSISEVSLSVSEYIPEEFYAKNLALKNNWIKYYLSFDDGKNWHRISPLEHTPVGVTGEEFPNKVISLNSNQSPEARVPNKTYATTDGSAKSIKLMAEFIRPDSSPDVTPVLYDYQIRIVPKESEEE